MKRVLFIESPVVKAIKSNQEWCFAIENIQDEMKNSDYGYCDVENSADDLSGMVDMELEIVGDDMYNLYIQIIGGQNECFDEIGSWEE